MPRLLVDTGFLVALFIRGDTWHQAALAFMQANRTALLTILPVIVETCFFLDVRGKCELLKWVERGGIEVIDVPIRSYPDITATLQKYADQDIDFTDAALVWLANQTGERAILTVDESDFSVYRLKGGKRFELVKWYSI